MNAPKGSAGVPLSWRGMVNVHPAADLFPMMSDGELDELAKNTLDNLTGLVRDERWRILALPHEKRVRLAQAYFNVFGVSVDLPRQNAG
jgi:hypothetical protein